MSNPEKKPPQESELERSIREDGEKYEAKKVIYAREVTRQEFARQDI